MEDCDIIKLWRYFLPLEFARVSVIGNFFSSFVGSPGRADRVIEVGMFANDETDDINPVLGRNCNCPVSRIFCVVNDVLCTVDFVVETEDVATQRCASGTVAEALCSSFTSAAIVA